MKPSPTEKLMGRWKWFAVLALFFVYGVVQALLKG